MSTLTIATRQKQHADGFSEAVVALSGTLDKSTVQLFEREISTLLAKKPRRIILETAALNHIHGQALECLNKAHLDIRGVSSIETRFLENFENPNPRVLVDFSAADSLSSLGIRMVVQGIKGAAARGGRTLILNPTAPIASALEMAGFAHFIARGLDSEIAEGLRSL